MSVEREDGEDIVIKLGNIPKLHDHRNVISKCLKQFVLLQEREKT